MYLLEGCTKGCTKKKGEVCTYLKDVPKDVPKKKFGFKVRREIFRVNSNNYLVATNEENETIAYLLRLKDMTPLTGAKQSIKNCGYDISDYSWSEKGEIKLNQIK